MIFNQSYESGPQGQHPIYAYTYIWITISTFECITSFDIFIVKILYAFFYPYCIFRGSKKSYRFRVDPLVSIILLEKMDPDIQHLSTMF